MNRRYVPYVAAAVLSIGSGASFEARANTSEKGRSETMQTTSADVVRGFFAAFSKGDLEGVATVHPDARVVAIREGARRNEDIYGSYAGKEGARAFVAMLGKSFDTQAFSVDGVVGEGDIAFASGRFTHRLKSTGKIFRSEWALRCVIQDGKILEYRFYEDSAAFAEASR